MADLFGGLPWWGVLLLVLAGLLAGFVGPYLQKNIQLGITLADVIEVILNELAAGRSARRQLALNFRKGRILWFQFLGVR